jgi:hypothetical protein
MTPATGALPPWIFAGTNGSLRIIFVEGFSPSATASPTVSSSLWGAASERSVVIAQPPPGAARSPLNTRLLASILNSFTSFGSKPLEAVGFFAACGCGRVRRGDASRGRDEAPRGTRGAKDPDLG